MDEAIKQDGYAFLEKSPICSVTFIWDYYQVVVGTYTLSIYTHPVVCQSGTETRFGSVGFADSLTALIGQEVTRVSSSSEEVELLLSDGRSLLISLLKLDRVSPGAESLTVTDVAGVTFLVEGDSG